MEKLKVEFKKDGRNGGYVIIRDSSYDKASITPLSGEFLYQLGDLEAVNLYMGVIFQNVYHRGVKAGFREATEMDMNVNPNHTLAFEDLMSENRELKKELQALKEEKSELLDSRDFLESALSLGKDISLQEDTHESKLLKRAYTALEEASKSARLEGWGDF